ncbi:Beta-galactosidase C-terminal domain [Micromonospora zamorensis]|uniref:Beta-galactosidase C-terminal domain n=1 Tax=Micromonospora zamorensis TaxID=709883 RepID=UPI003D92EBED
MSLPVTAKVPFGGDYNPEQWPEDVWKQDHRLFDSARIDLVTNVAAGLDQAGVSWVVRQVLARHDVLGPYPDTPDLESAVRVAPDGSRLLFLLNHRTEPVEVTAPTSGVDLLTGDRTLTGSALRLPAYGVVVLREDG